MAARQLTDLQQQVYDLLKQGYIGEFWSEPTHSYGRYRTEVCLKKGANTWFAKYATIQALENKGLVKINKEKTWFAGTFQLVEAS